MARLTLFSCLPANLALHFNKIMSGNETEIPCITRCVSYGKVFPN